MADDLHARTQELEAELRRRDDRDAAAQAENRALREQQTATAEVLRAIASSSAGLPKALDAICEAACQLCHAQSSIITRVEEPAPLPVTM